MGKIIEKSLDLEKRARDVNEILKICFGSVRGNYTRKIPNPFRKNKIRYMRTNTLKKIVRITPHNIEQIGHFYKPDGSALSIFKDILGSNERAVERYIDLFERRFKERVEVRFTDESQKGYTNLLKFLRERFNYWNPGL